MSMISDMQTELIKWFPDKASGGLPEKVAPYGGELKDPRGIRTLPALFVDVPSNFQIESEDAKFQLLNMNGTPELVLFDRNAASGKDNRSDIAKLIDWTIEQMQGSTITINLVPLPVSRVEARILTDYDDKIAAAVLTLYFTSFQD